MNLKDLVPPLELCKLIPEGEFSGSVLCWIDFRGVYPEYSYGDPVVVERETSWAATSKKGVYPAPTLQEILEDGDPIYELHVKHKPGANQSMAENALKAWLKRKNVKYEVCLWCGGNMTGDYDNSICSHCGQRTEKVEVIK